MPKWKMAKCYAHVEVSGNQSFFRPWSWDAGLTVNGPIAPHCHHGLPWYHGSPWPYVPPMAFHGTMAPHGLTNIKQTQKVKQTKSKS